MPICVFVKNPNNRQSLRWKLICQLRRQKWQEKLVSDLKKQCWFPTTQVLCLPFEEQMIQEILGKHKTSPVADPGFRRGVPTAQVGTPTYCLGKFFPKTAWKWKIFGHSGTRVPGVTFSFTPPPPFSYAHLLWRLIVLQLTSTVKVTKLTGAVFTFTVGGITFTVSDETYRRCPVCSYVSFITNCKSFITNCKSYATDCKSENSACKFYSQWPSPEQQWG